MGFGSSKTELIKLFLLVPLILMLSKIIMAITLQYLDLSKISYNKTEL